MFPKIVPLNQYFFDHLRGFSILADRYKSQIPIPLITQAQNPCCRGQTRRCLAAANDHVRIVGPVVLLIASLLCGCKKPAAVVLPPPIVEVMDITTSEVPLTATIIGQLDSPQNVEVRARVEAFVDKISFVEGVEVKEGDVLFQLDKKPFIEKLAAANGSLAEAKASLGKYQADVARLEPLYAKKAIPKQDLDNAVAAVDVGKAGVSSAEARVVSAQLDLGYCDVKAPMTGLIGAKQVSIGDLVGKGQPTLLATMSTLDPIWFYCNVSEVSYIKVKEWSSKMSRDIFSLPLTLMLANGSEHPKPGSFIFIDRAVDVKTGTIRMRAQFPNPERLLRPGMFARVRIDLGTRKDCLQVPERAVVELQGKAFLWVISQDGKSNQRPVKIGETNGSNMIVLDGIKPGERIVVEGVQKVREGGQVTVKPASAVKVQPAKE